jgi:hypothetical protein
MDGLPDNAVRRAVSAAGLMASPVDGEALGATRALCRLLERHGLDPATVIGAGLLQTPASAPARRVTGPVPVRPLRPHQLAARQCLAFGEMLTDWEREFCASVADLRSLSTKQQAQLNVIAVRAERGRR